MANGSRSTNTMTEGLRVLLADLADMKIMPDADLPFVLDIEQRIVAKLREPIDSIYQQGNSEVAPPGMPGGEMMPPPMPPGPGMGMGAPGPMDQQVPGLSQRRVPNMDEMRRVLSQ